MQFIFLFLSLHSVLFSYTLYQSEASDSSITTSPPIEEVTIYFQGTQVTHRTTIEIPPGQHSLVFNGLNAKINSKNTTVGFDGDVEIISINHRSRQLENQDSSEVTNRLFEEKEDIENQIRGTQIEFDVISYEQDMLRNNLQPEDSDVESLRNLLSLHRKRIRILRTESNFLTSSLDHLQSRHKSGSKHCNPN